MNIEPVVLDKWDSQLVWIAKGWVDKDGIDKITACKNLWTHRCYIDFQYVEVVHIISRCLNILKYTMETEKLLNKIIGWLVPQHEFTCETLYTDNKGYLENALKQLLREMNILPVKEKGYVTMKIEPLDKSVILNKS